MLGCQRIFMSARNAWSQAVAVVAAGILGVERHQQDPVAALLHQRLEPVLDGRLPVAHRPVDAEARVGEGCGQARRTGFRVMVFSGLSSRSLFQIEA